MPSTKSDVKIIMASKGLIITDAKGLWINLLITHDARTNSDRPLQTVRWHWFIGIEWGFCPDNLGFIPALSFRSGPVITLGTISGMHTYSLINQAYSWLIN